MTKATILYPRLHAVLRGKNVQRTLLVQLTKSEYVHCINVIFPKADSWTM